MNAEIIFKYINDLSDKQKEQINALGNLYAEWNSKINVISRKDIDNLYEHHVLHSMAISQVVNFTEGTRVLDIGTGGGFPGIPLAILFPHVQFHLIDSIGKKIKVATGVADAIGLKNVNIEQKRAEKEKGLYDFIVSRAVMPMPDIVKISRKNIDTINRNQLKNGWICLKGGDLENELERFKEDITAYNIKEIYNEPFFDTKQIIYLPSKANQKQ